MTASISATCLRLALTLSTALVAAPAFADAPNKVLLLVNGSLGDKSFFDSAAHGLDLIKEKYGDAVQTRVLEIGDDPTKFEPALLDASEQDWDIIVAGTYSLAEAVAEVAPQFPDQQYIVYDASVPYADGDFGNVFSIEYKQNEGAYLAGMLGAGLIKAGVTGDAAQLGFIGGMDIPVINDFMIGYVAGAQAVLPEVKVQISYVGSFADAAKGKELGLAQFNTGVGLGFSAASQAGLGQLAAAKEAGKLTIGVDSDQEAIFAETDPAIAEKVVSSVLKNVDVSLVAAYDQFVAGTLPFGQSQVMGLKEGAVGLVDGANLAKIAPAEVVEALKAATDAIAQGAIEVPTALGKSSDEIAAVRNAVRP